MLQSQTTPVDLSGKNLSYNAIHSSNDQKKVIPAAHAPASTYAIIKTMPKLLPAVEEALSNNSCTCVEMQTIEVVRESLSKTMIHTSLQKRMLTIEGNG